MKKKHNPYKIISELLLNGPHPNIDMLIVKPTLYAYIPNDKIDDVSQNGLPSDNNKQIKVYFSRVPETIEKYQEFHKQFSPIKVMISRLKKIKDQVVKILPINLDGYKNSLTEDDIKKISQNNRFFTDYFEKGEDLQNIPHAVIHVEKGILPSFCLKILTPEKRLIEGD